MLAEHIDSLLPRLMHMLLFILEKTRFTQYIGNSKYKGIVTVSNELFP